jgi:hypothetical protein
MENSTAAKGVCEEKPSASDCAIAWEEAHELEMAKKRRKRRRESMNQKAEEEVEEEDREPTPSSPEELSVRGLLKFFGFGQAL